MNPRGLIRRHAATTLASAFACGFLSLFLVAEGRAQQLPRYVEVDPSFAAEVAARGETVQPHDIREAIQKANSLFRLFGEGDRAWSSLRMVGDNQIKETNTGPGDDINLFASSAIDQSGTANGTWFQTFGIPLMWGVPRSEWLDFLEAGVESLRNVRGSPPGYSVMWNGDIFARTKDLNAADGLVGTILSGETSTEDGSCLDHSAFLGGGSIDAGFQLLPASNCPVTWSAGGTWLGDRPISLDSWVEVFEAQGPNFAFNRWQVPDELKDQSRFLGNNVSVYGHFNDYNSTVLAKFGEVVPGGSGDATREGYPLGLDVVFNSFSFTVPTVANVKFWGGLFINNSQAVYGVPNDYDSVYVGIGMWPGRRQDGDNYSIPEKGAWVSAESSDPASASCQAVDPVPLLGNRCGGFEPRQDGFEVGAHGVVVLKSPIGDLRNKLFSDPSSPFFMAGHPLAGDTITFNHSVNWNFGPWGAVWNQGNDRQRFGVLSSTAENILNGTACADFFTNGTRWPTFASNDWPENQCAPGYYVPGDWTYTSGRPSGADPAGPDTLWLAGCGPTGCPEPWADSTWQGWHINNFGNLSQLSIGPFRLAAGDTTEFLLAFYSGKDSVSFEAITDGIVDFYLGFFQGPEAPPPVTIRGVDIGAGVAPGEGADITLVWGDEAEDYVDPFLAKFADDMVAAGAGTDLAIIRDANPGIVDRVRARAADNLDRLLLFRSCDGGGTFDANGDCEADRAIDESGNSVEPGWQAYTIFQPDASGDVANTFTDGSIVPGVTYLYTIVGQSKGFEEVVITDPDARSEEVAAAETVGAGDGTETNFTGTLSSVPVVPSSVTITAGVQTVTDDGNGNLVGDVDPLATETNTIDYSTGAFDVTFALPPTDLADIDADYRFRVFTCGAGPCQTDTLRVAPSIIGPLSRATSDPNVLSVYVPASGAAGGRLAGVEFSDRDANGNATVPFDILLTSGGIRSNSFSAIFGNRIEITEWRDAATEELDSVAVSVLDVALAATETGTETFEVVLASQTFKRTDGIPVTLNAASSTGESTAGGVLTRTFEIGPDDLDPDDRFASGLVLVERVGESQLPLLATGRLDGRSATPGGFLANPGYPGFFVSADNTEAGEFNQLYYLVGEDTLSANLDPTLNLDQSNTNNAGVQGLTFGTYSITFTDSVFGPGAPFTLNFFDPEQTDQIFDASLAARGGPTSSTDPAIAELLAEELDVAPEDVDLVAANIPFTVRNVTYNRDATLAMLNRGTATKVLGIGPDTMSVTVDPDRWIPGDPVYVIEQLSTYRTREVGDETVIVVDGNNDPIVDQAPVLTLAPLSLTCGLPNATCNPVRGAGFGSWVGTSPNDDLRLEWFSPFTTRSVYSFVPSPSVQGQQIIDDQLSIAEMMEQIQVVPNPYLFFSAYEATTAQRRLMFTNLPPDGEIRIYTIAGNFVQEIDWAPGDLAGNGDLFWDLQTREGNEIGPGLYIYVVKATDPATGGELKKMGKFVVIR